MLLTFSWHSDEPETRCAPHPRHISTHALFLLTPCDSGIVSVYSEYHTFSPKTSRTVFRATRTAQRTFCAAAECPTFAKFRRTGLPSDDNYSKLQEFPPLSTPFPIQCYNGFPKCLSCRSGFESLLTCHIFRIQAVPYKLTTKEKNTIYIYIYIYIVFFFAYVLPHAVFKCFVWISEQTAITSLYNIN